MTSPSRLESIVENHTDRNEDEIDTAISHAHSADHPRWSFQWLPSEHVTKTTRAFSCHEDRTSSSENHGRLKHICDRLKRRFTISKECPTGDEKIRGSSVVRSSNYKPFSSSFDATYTDFEWPDFEELYDTIPTCLAKALPGLDDLSLGETEEKPEEAPNFLVDEADEQWKLFQKCKRGKHCRRNAICPKLDKSVYKGQLNTFIQQLMIEKLMRTWT